MYVVGALVVSTIIDAMVQRIVSIISAAKCDMVLCVLIIIIGTSLSKPHTSERFHRVNYAQQQTDEVD